MAGEIVEHVHVYVEQDQHAQREYRKSQEVGEEVVDVEDSFASQPVSDFQNLDNVGQRMVLVLGAIKVFVVDDVRLRH